MTTEATESTEMRDGTADLVFREESYAIRGAIFEVYSQLGAGFSESVYHEALERELADRGIPFESQKALRIRYKGKELSQAFRVDVLCFGKIVLELKSVRALLPEHEAQLLNYLKAGSFRLGFLVNFSSCPKADIRRMAN